MKRRTSKVCFRAPKRATFRSPFAQSTESDDLIVSRRDLAEDAAAVRHCILLPLHRPALELCFNVQLVYEGQRYRRSSGLWALARDLRLEFG
eukprot:SAG11_NODE_5416_length_1566_cov_2.108384_3_plen_92_part_00